MACGAYLHTQPFRTLAHNTRQRPTDIYMQNSPLALDKQARVAIKNNVLQDVRAQGMQQLQDWRGDTPSSTPIDATNHTAGAHPFATLGTPFNPL